MLYKRWLDEEFLRKSAGKNLRFAGVCAEADLGKGKARFEDGWEGLFAGDRRPVFETREGIAGYFSGGNFQEHADQPPLSRSRGEE